MDNQDTPQFTHVLKTTGILAGFSIAKTMTVQDLEKIKKEAQAQAKNDEECAKLIKQKLAKLGDMHDKDDVVPGIIYTNGIHPGIRDELIRMARKLSKEIINRDLEATEEAFVIREMISELELIASDFESLGGNDESGEESDEESDEETSEDDDYRDDSAE